MTLDSRHINLRQEAWNIATELIDPIIAEHGLETFRTGPPFGHTTTFTKVDQHIDHVIRIADWLIGDNCD